MGLTDILVDEKKKGYMALKECIENILLQSYFYLCEGNEPETFRGCFFLSQGKECPMK